MINFGATHLARFPAASSAATTIGPLPPPGTWDSMAFDPNGLLYVGLVASGENDPQESYRKLNRAENSAPL
jgi:hypothetical protein